MVTDSMATLEREEFLDADECAASLWLLLEALEEMPTSWEGQDGLRSVRDLLAKSTPLGCDSGRRQVVASRVVAQLVRDSRARSSPGGV